MSRIPLIKAPTQARFNSFFNKNEACVYPLWMMRQAGRYLPEYQELRQRYGSFMKLCSTPELAAEITLQPLRRFELDAAIIFADILLPLLCFKGIKLHFDDLQGPLLQADHNSILQQQEYRAPREVLSYVAQALNLVKKELHPYQELIGFCGGPWTVALYAFEGGNSQSNFQKAFSVLLKQPQLFEDWLAILRACSLDYLRMQVEAGATQIMIFESWAGLCPNEFWQTFMYEPAMQLIADFKEYYPKIPVVYYPKGVVPQVVNQTFQPFDVLACDHSIELRAIMDKTTKAVQGNVDPQLLLSSNANIANSLEEKFSKLDKSIIVNLGHGIDPKTLPEQVSFFVEEVRRQEKIKQNSLC